MIKKDAVFIDIHLASNNRNHPLIHLNRRNFYCKIPNLIIETVNMKLIMDKCSSYIAFIISEHN